VDGESTFDAWDPEAHDFVADTVMVLAATFMEHDASYLIGPSFLVDPRDL
jgi:hypothetical protein